MTTAETNSSDGLPEKIGSALGFIVMAVVYAAVALLMARASGWF